MGAANAAMPTPVVNPFLAWSLTWSMKDLLEEGEVWLFMMFPKEDGEEKDYQSTGLCSGTGAVD